MTQQMKYKLIEEEALRDLIINNYQQSFSIILLSHVCARHNIDISLTTQEACGVLELSPRQLEEARRLCKIRSLGMGKDRIYSAFDLVTIATQLHRKKMMNYFKNFPTYTAATLQDK